MRGTPGEPIVVRGLPQLVKQAKETFGLTATYESVRSKVYGDDERKLFRCAKEDGDDHWIEITRDENADAAYELAQENAVLNDDREENYMADVWVTAHEDGKDWQEHRWNRVRAMGLVNLIGEAAMLVNDAMKGVPPSMEFEAVKMRMPNLRSQMSKSRSAGKPVYSIAFPTVKDGHWKAPNNWQVRIYVDVAKDYEEPIKTRGFERRDVTNG